VHPYRTLEPQPLIHRNRRSSNWRRLRVWWCGSFLKRHPYFCPDCQFVGFIDRYDRYDYTSYLQCIRPGCPGDKRHIELRRKAFGLANTKPYEHGLPRRVQYRLSDKGRRWFQISGTLLGSGVSQIIVGLIPPRTLPQIVCGLLICLAFFVIALVVSMRNRERIP